MESVVKVKKSLRRPIRKLTNCVSGVKQRKGFAKHRRQRGRGGGGGGGGGRRGSGRLRKTPPIHAAHNKEPSVSRWYRADLEKERKLREAMNAQKNAERAAMRAHFRRKYQLSKDPKDTNHLNSARGKVSLPHELAKLIHPETKRKDDSFNLLRAFQGLSFGTAPLSGRKQTKTPTRTPHRGETCKTM